MMLHLLSVSASEKIQQHYMAYAKAHGLCDREISYKDWDEDFFELERKLQSEWQQAYAQLLNESADLDTRLLWLEQHFFKLELTGFDNPNIHFKEHGITASFLTILLNEILVNAFKYYSSVDKQPVALQWQERDGYQVLSCSNPSIRSERAIQKGSGKGHTFLSALARKTGSEFSRPKPQDHFVLKFAIANELLISN
jgi:two-component sensor histidine kinase